jgi:hypothetical protein
MRLSRTFHPAQAASTLVLHITSEFGPISSLNGVALCANTPFSFHAVGE